MNYNYTMNKKGEAPLDYQIYLFHQGTAQRAYDVMGAHPEVRGSARGFVFRTWAPNAKRVCVAGDFNGWSGNNPMKKITDQGLWEVFIPGVSEFDAYKYLVDSGLGETRYRADPYGYHSELRPGTASKLFSIDKYKWQDKEWQHEINNRPPYGEPINIYEVHFGSWRKYKDGNFFDYYKMAEELIPYVKDMGYTHIELMPMSEYPYDGSWGYQGTGYYAATSRYGTPDGLMAFIDESHQNGIGVILDWVPGHFPKDEAGLRMFDGGYCYEYKDNLKNENKGWGTMVFDWGRNEVRSFLISNAIFWFDKFHADGLRVDAVASMLYLDFGKEGEKWRSNVHGGNENLEAIALFKDLNKAVFENYPYALMIAEESTSWPQVTKPTHTGGLGFNFKWNMGWMNDSLSYISYDPYFKSDGHNKLTFALTYFTSENYILPLSHDEVVHMKGSLINKMPGNYEEKFANLRAYLAYTIAHPGKKLLFMGGEFAQFAEWDYQNELDWNLLEYPAHREFHQFVKELNAFYKANDELWELDYSWDGFEWIDPDDRNRNLLAFKRKNRSGSELIVISNFAGISHDQYNINLNKKERYELLFSSADVRFGGKGHFSPFIERSIVGIPDRSTSIWRKIQEV